MAYRADVGGDEQLRQLEGQLVERLPQHGGTSASVRVVGSLHGTWAWTWALHMGMAHGKWHRANGTGHRAHGWRVACGVWCVVCGVCGVWRVACVACGVWRVACREGDGERDEEHDGEVQVEELVLVAAALGYVRARVRLG